MKTCVTLTLECVAETESTFLNYALWTYIALEKVDAAVTSSTPVEFHLVRPGLTKKPNTVSLMSKETPGWYLRHYGYHLYLESSVDPRNPRIFDKDATFVERLETFFEGFTAFQSVNYPEYYIRVNDKQQVYIGRFENTTTFKKSASFTIDLSDSSVPTMVNSSPASDIDTDLSNSSVPTMANSSPASDIDTENDTCRITTIVLVVAMVTSLVAGIFGGVLFGFFQWRRRENDAFTEVDAASKRDSPTELSTIQSPATFDNANYESLADEHSTVVNQKGMYDCISKVADTRESLYAEVT